MQVNMKYRNSVRISKLFTFKRIGRIEKNSKNHDFKISYPRVIQYGRSGKNPPSKLPKINPYYDRNRGEYL